MICYTISSIIADRVRIELLLIMMKSLGRRSFSLAKGDVLDATRAYERRPRAASQEPMSFFNRRPSVSRLSPTEDNRLKHKFEVIDVLLQILLHQDELTLKEYTINDSKIKVLVIEDTEF